MKSVLLFVFALSAACLASPANTGDLKAPVASVPVETPTVAEESAVPQVAAVSSSNLNAQEAQVRFFAKSAEKTHVFIWK